MLLSSATECEEASLRNHCFFLKTADHMLFVAADNETEKEMWMEAILG